MMGHLPAPWQSDMVQAIDGAGTSPRAVRPPAAVAPGRRTSAWIALAAVAAAIGGSCRGGAPTPRIVYPLPWLTPTLIRVAQPEIDRWGQPRVAELPESLMARVTVPPGYAGDIAYAEAMAAMPGLVAAV